ncbi:MAG: septum formation initiator family protein [Solirubrobacteraceae bacterium]|jgi:cell division protein FtsB
MPSARSATAPPRRSPRTAPGAGPAGRARPDRFASRRPQVRIRWDRIGRVGLLIVLTVVVGLYVQHALSYLDTRAQADEQQATVKRLARANAQLERQQQSLSDPSTIVADARAYGMVFPGERPYAITGSSSP